MSYLIPSEFSQALATLSLSYARSLRIMSGLRNVVYSTRIQNAPHDPLLTAVYHSLNSAVLRYGLVVILRLAVGLLGLRGRNPPSGYVYLSS